MYIIDGRSIHSEVFFTNILRATFSTLSFSKKKIQTLYCTEEYIIVYHRKTIIEHHFLQKAAHEMHVKLALWVNFINIAQNKNPFLVHSIWQIANKQGKKCAKFSSKFRVSIYGEIE